MLHNADTAAEITALIKSSFIKVDATNTVRQWMGMISKPSQVLPRTRDHIPSDTIYTRSWLTSPGTRSPTTPTLPSTTQAGRTPLQTHAQSRELRTALVAGGADPSALVDEQGNTVLHNAQTAEEITALLKAPLVDINLTNEVPRPFLS